MYGSYPRLNYWEDRQYLPKESPWFADISDAIGSLRKSRHELDKLADGIGRLDSNSRPITPHYLPARYDDSYDKPYYNYQTDEIPTRNYSPANQIHRTPNNNRRDSSPYSTYYNPDHGDQTYRSRFDQTDDDPHVRSDSEPPKPSKDMESILRDFQDLLSKELETVKNENEELKMSNKEIKDNLDNKSAELANIHPKYLQLEADLIGANQYVNDLVASLDRLEDEKEELEVNLAVRNEDSKQLSRQLENFQEAKHQNDLDRQECQLKLDGALNEQKRILDDKKELEEEHAEVKELNSQLRDDCEELTNQLAVAQKEVDRLRNQGRDSRMDLLDGKTTDQEQFLAELLRLKGIADNNLPPRFDVSVQTEDDMVLKYREATEAPHTSRQLGAGRIDQIDFASDTAKPAFDQEKEFLKEAYTNLQQELKSIKQTIYSYQENHRRETEALIAENVALKRQLQALQNGKHLSGETDILTERGSPLQRKLSGSSETLSKAEQRTERRYLREEKRLGVAVSHLQKDNLLLKNKCKRLEELLQHQETDSTLNSDLESINAMPSSTTAANKHIGQIKDHLSESQQLLAKQNELIDLLDRNQTWPPPGSVESKHTSIVSSKPVVASQTVLSATQTADTQTEEDGKVVSQSADRFPDRESHHSDNSEAIMNLTNEISTLNDSLRAREESFELLREKTDRYDRLSLNTSEELSALRNHLSELQDNGQAVARNTELLQNNFESFSGNWKNWSSEVSQEFNTCDVRISRVESAINELSQKFNSHPTSLSAVPSMEAYDKEDSSSQLKSHSPISQPNDNTTSPPTLKNGRRLPDTPDISPESISSAAKIPPTNDFHTMIFPPDKVATTTATRQKRYSRRHSSNDKDEEFSSDSIDDSAILKSSLLKEIDRLKNPATINSRSASEDSDSNLQKVSPSYRNRNGVSHSPEKEESKESQSPRHNGKLKSSIKRDSTDSTPNKTDSAELFSNISGSSARDLLDLRRSRPRADKLTTAPVSTTPSHDDSGSESGGSMVVMEDSEPPIEEPIEMGDSIRLRNAPKSDHEEPNSPDAQESLKPKIDENENDNHSPKEETTMIFNPSLIKNSARPTFQASFLSKSNDSSNEDSNMASTATTVLSRKSSDRSVRFVPEPEVYYKTPSETETETETDSSSSPQTLAEEDDWLAEAEKQLQTLNSGESDNESSGKAPKPSKRFLENRNGVLNLQDYHLSSEDSKSYTPPTDQSNQRQSVPDNIATKPIHPNKGTEDFPSDEFDDFTTSASVTLSSDLSPLHRRFRREEESTPIVSREKSGDFQDESSATKPPPITDGASAQFKLDAIPSLESPTKRNELSRDVKLIDSGTINKSKDSGFGESGSTWNSLLQTGSVEVSDDHSESDSVGFSNSINPHKIRAKRVEKIRLGLPDRNIDRADQLSSNSPSDIDQSEERKTLSVLSDRDEENKVATKERRKFFSDEENVAKAEHELPPIPPVRKKRSSTQSPVPPDEVSGHTESSGHPRKDREDTSDYNLLRSRDSFSNSPFGDLEKVPEEPEVITDMSDEVASIDDLDEGKMSSRDTMRTPTPFDPVCSRDDSTATESDDERNSTQPESSKPTEAAPYFYHHAEGYFDGEKFVDPAGTGPPPRPPLPRHSNKEKNGELEDSTSSLEDTIFNPKVEVLQNSDTSTSRKNKSQVYETPSQNHPPEIPPPYKETQMVNLDKSGDRPSSRDIPDALMKDDEFHARETTPVRSPVNNSHSLNTPNTHPEDTDSEDNSNYKKPRGSLLLSRQIAESSSVDGGSLEGGAVNRSTPMLELESSFENIYDPGVTPRKHPATKLPMEDEDYSYLTDSSYSSIDAKPSASNNRLNSSIEDLVDFDPSETDASSTKSQSPTPTLMGNRQRFRLTEDFLPPITRNED